MHVGFNLLFLIPGETGGRETYARELIDAIFQRQPDLHATAFVNRDMGSTDRERLGQVMRVVRLPVSARRAESWAVGEIGALPVAAARARVDLLHSLANFGPGTGPFRRVVTLHDLQYRALPELMTPARRRATGALIGLATRGAARVITVSSAAAQELRTITRLDPDRITVVPNGVRPPAPVAPEAVTALRQRLGVGPAPLTLTVASNLAHKNLPLVIEALKRIEPAQRPTALIAGHGTDGDGLASVARGAGMIEHVRLLGGVGPDELETLYALADCVVLPTLYEGFGLPALEAMVRGVPVVCSDIPPLREITGDAALRFDPNRADQAAAAITRVLSDPQLSDRLRRAGRERAKRYSWTAAAEATLTVYRDALGVA